MPNLTGSSALDVAIGLALVYTLFSLLCSTVQEAIAGFLDLRSKTLVQGLQNMLDDGGTAERGAAAPVQPQPPAARRAVGTAAGASAPPCGPPAMALSQQMLAHGVMRTLYKESAIPGRHARRGPSYIPKESFAVALLDLMAPGLDASDRVAEIRRAIADAALPPGTKSALLAIAKSAGADHTALRKGIEQWFDATMDRVSGWYKRQTQLIICLLSAAVVVVFNVNTVAIAQRLIHDDSVRAAVAQVATNTHAKNAQGAADAIGHVHQLGLPLGWGVADLHPNWWSTFGGWVISFFALSLGAPFWFDTLGKLAGLRNAGGKPDDSGGG
jgi:hypothetical protein